MLWFFHDSRWCYVPRQNWKFPLNGTCPLSWKPLLYSLPLIFFSEIIDLIHFNFSLSNFRFILFITNKKLFLYWYKNISIFEFSIGFQFGTVLKFLYSVFWSCALRFQLEFPVQEGRDVHLCLLLLFDTIFFPFLASGDFGDFAEFSSPKQPPQR